MSFSFPEASPETLEELSHLTKGRLTSGIVIEMPFYDFIFPCGLWKTACSGTVGFLGSFPAIAFREAMLGWAVRPCAVSFIDIGAVCLLVEQDISELPGWRQSPEACLECGLSKGWQDCWTHKEPGQLRHQSGITVLFHDSYHYWGRSSIAPEAASLAIYKARQRSKGIPEPILSVKIAKLVKEAWLWLEFCGQPQ